MRARRIRFMFAILAVTTILAASSARASVIVQSTETTGQTYNYMAFGGVFSQFDPSLGSLQAIILTFSGTVTYSVSFALDPAYEPPCDSDCSAAFGFSTGYLFNAPGFPIAVFPEDADMFEIVNWSGSTGVPADLSPQSQSFDLAYEGNPASLAGYIGRGDISVAGLISEDSDYCSDSGVTCALSDHLDLTTTLTYIYVPEPESLVLLGAGLMGLGAMRARHRMDAAGRFRIRLV